MLTTSAAAANRPAVADGPEGGPGLGGAVARSSGRSGCSGRSIVMSAGARSG